MIVTFFDINCLSGLLTLISTYLLTLSKVLLRESSIFLEFPMLNEQTSKFTRNLFYNKIVEWKLLAPINNKTWINNWMLRKIITVAFSTARDPLLQKLLVAVPKEVEIDVGPGFLTFVF